MEITDLEYFSGMMLNDIATIVHNQQVLAGIHAELNENLFRPFEQDFIYQEHYGASPSQPRSLEINGVTITTSVLHQTGIGLRDVKGADLLYEIEGEKFGLIQYKRSNNQKVRGDIAQLQELLSNCPARCFHNRRRPIPKTWLPLMLNGFCGAWYCVIDSNGEQKFTHACEAESIFMNNQSVQSKEFKFGLTKSTFLELFSACRVGARVRHLSYEKLKALYLENLVESYHLIYELVQKGRWSR